MFVDFTESQRILLQSFRDFARTRVAPLVEASEANETTPVEVFSEMGELGYLCLNYPEQYGGAGTGLIEACILFEELGFVSAGIAGSIMSHCGIATSALKSHGTEELRTKYLRNAIKGKVIASFGLSEANAGSDVASIQTTARRSGNHYILNGSKMYITNGNICGFSTVAASTDRSKGHRGISLFAVGAGTKGFERRKLHKFCIRSSDTAEFTFSDCVIDASSLIGEEGKGFQYLMESLDEGRILHAAVRVGSANSAMTLALDYAKQRVQFGRPIGSNQAIAFKLARMAVDVEAAKWLVYRAGYLYDSRQPCAKEASMAKLLASEVYQRVALESAQIHGGATALQESPANRHYRDSYLGKVTEGTSEIQELVIARHLGIQGLK